VDDYLSEREQIEQVRGWVREYLPWLAGAVLIAGAIVWGRPQFAAWQMRQSSAADEKYTAVLEALNKGDKAAAARIAAELKADYGRTPYADLASLAVSRFDVDSHDLDDAASRLEAVSTGARDEQLRVIARLRLARVQRAQGKLDLALATLAAPPAGAAAAYADARGDVLADKGDRDGALAEWRAALADKSPGIVNRELIELKIAGIGSAPAAQPAAKAPAAAPAAPAATPAAAPAPPAGAKP